MKVVILAHAESKKPKLQTGHFLTPAMKYLQE